jgi:predicted site-specific integrase-resolvase
MRHLLHTVIDETETKPQGAPERVVLYARVSSVEYKDRLTRFGFRYLEAL